MDVLQGRYLNKITSKGGKLKGLQIETGDGIQSIYLPKPLRTIAQQELDAGDELRVWTTHSKTALSQKKHSQKKRSQKNSKKKKSQQRWAVQVIPLSPKAQVADRPTVAQQPANRLEKESEKKLEKKLEKKSGKKSGNQKKQKKRKNKPVTVQLCQKKNCCKRGGTQLWQSFEQTAQDSSQTPFKLEAVGCLGGCKRGPNIRFLPDNVKHYHVQPDDVSSLLARHQA